MIDRSSNVGAAIRKRQRGFLLNPFRFGGSGYTSETNTWVSRIGALGGSVTTPEKDLADALIQQIQAASYGSKIIYLLPFIGGNIAAHRVPLRDTRNVGAAANSGFVDADCTTAGGIANPTEAAKILNTGITPVMLGAPGTQRGGLFFWERNLGLGTGVEPMGCYDLFGGGTDRYVLDLRSTMQRFRWGNASGTLAGPGTTATNGFYYAQASSNTLRRIYKDGTTLGSDGTSSSTIICSNAYIRVMGCVTHTTALTYWKGRCGVAGATDGTMSDADVAALYTLLDTYLITPTGR